MVAKLAPTVKTAWTSIVKSLEEIPYTLTGVPDPSRVSVKSFSALSNQKGN